MENMTTVNDSTNDGSGFNAMIGGTEVGGGCGGGNGGGGGENGGGAEEMNLKKGPWTAAEDAILIDYVTKHGEGNWNAVQRNTGLARCGKSCRLRWANHLRPNLKKGAFSPEEEKLIIELHAQFGNKWARMAGLLPGRTDNEIKNYWNTRVKRRQRQGLPLYSDDPDRPTTPTTPTTPVTPSGSNPNNIATTKFEFFHQNHLHSPTTPHHHSPLSSPLQHRASSYSPRTFLDPTLSPLSSSTHSPLSSSAASSPLSFTFQRPAPLLCSPLRFKRYRSSPSYNLQFSPTNTITPESPLNLSTPTAHLSDLDGFRFPVQLNSSSFSHFFQNPSLLDSDRGGVSSSSSPSAFPAKLELPSNQFSLSQPYQIEPEVKLDIEFNDPSMQTNSGLLGDLLLEAQALASGHNSKKRNYLSLNEANNDVFDGCQSFDDLPLSSLYWSSASGLKPKEEATEVSKSMNEDLSTLLTVMPTTMQGQDWQHNSATEVSNVQSSCVMTDDNFGLDIKPIASLFPLSNATNHSENPGCYSWDNLPGLC